MRNYEKGGYERRYSIRKITGIKNGKITTKAPDPEADYFVLRLDTDPHALQAIHAYALSVRIVNEELSNDLMKIYRYYRGKELPPEHHFRVNQPKHPFK